MNDEAEDKSTSGQLEQAAARAVDLDALPKALSEDEREALLDSPVTYTEASRALALIDALTAHLAEAVARMTVAEAALDRRNAECEDAQIRLSEQTERAERADGRLAKLGYVAQRDRAQAAEARVRALQSLNESVMRERDEAIAFAEAAEARVRELEAERDEALVHVAELEAGNAELRRRIANQAAAHDLPRVQDVAALHAAEQKLAAANALLRECTDDTVPNWPAIERARAHLAGQPAEPSRFTDFYGPDDEVHAGQPAVRRSGK